MRILTVIYEYPPVGGGGGRAAQDICRTLVERGHEVHVLTAHIKGLPNQEIIDGAQVTRIPSARRVPFEASLAAMSGFVIAGSWAGLRHVRQWKPDVIHVHFAVPSGPVAWFLSRITGIPYVLTAHLGDVPGAVPEKTDKWFRWIFPLTPLIWRDTAQAVTVSKFTRQLASNYYPVDIQVLPNGVDLSSLDPGEISLGVPPRIIFAGRFSLQKNPHQFVHTLAGLQDMDWTAVMVGDGPLYAEVEREIHDQNLHERISLTGWLTPEEVISWYTRSDILFMPSLSEGFPIVGVQASAMGLAIIASRVGGFMDIVEEPMNGYLYAPDDTAGFQSGLRSYLNNPEALLQARLNSRQLAHRFELGSIVDDYINIFSRVKKQPVQKSPPKTRSKGFTLTKPRTSTLLRFAGTIISIGLIIYLLSRQGWQEIAGAIQQIPPWMLLLTLGLMFFSRFAVTARWHVLLRTALSSIRYSQTLRITFAGLFTTNFLPTTIGGDVVRLAGLVRLNYDPAVSTASLITDRLVGMVGMAMALPLAIPSLKEAGGIMQLFSQSENNQVVNLTAVVLPAWLGNLRVKVKNIARRLVESLSIWSAKPRSLLSSLGFTWVHMLCLYAIIYLLLTGMTEEVSFWQIGGLYSLVYFFTLLPISINGYGLQELSITVVFSSLAGVSVSSALTMALLFRTLMLLASLPGAVFLPGVMAGEKSKAGDAASHKPAK